MNLNNHYEFLSTYADTKFRPTPNLGKSINIFNIIGFVMQLATILRDIILARSEDKARIRELATEIRLLKEQLHPDKFELKSNFSNNETFQK